MVNAMHEILNLQQHLEAILRHMPVVLFTLDNTGVFRVCDGKPLRHILKTDMSLIGQSVFDVAGEYADIVEYVRRALAGETFTAMVAVHNHSFETRYEPLRYPCGRQSGMRGIALVTQRIGPEPSLARLDQGRAEPCAFGTAAQLLSPLTEHPEAAPTPTLTTRECDVLQRVAAGMSNRAIADDLIMSPATVKWHLEQIYQKLQAHNRCGAVTQARALGLLP